MNPLRNSRDVRMQIRTSWPLLGGWNRCGAIGRRDSHAVVGTTPANAKPEFAAQTGLPCGQCHQNPAGGGKLKSFGEKFKANGNKVPKK